MSAQTGQRVRCWGRATPLLCSPVGLPTWRCRPAAWGAAVQLPTIKGFAAPGWRDVDFIEPPLCDRLGIPLPFSLEGDASPVSAAALADPPAYDRARAVARYSGVMRRLIHDLKIPGPAGRSRSLHPLAPARRRATDCRRRPLGPRAAARQPPLEPPLQPVGLAGRAAGKCLPRY